MARLASDQPFRRGRFARQAKADLVGPNAWVDDPLRRQGGKRPCDGICRAPVSNGDSVEFFWPSTPSDREMLLDATVKL
jgi:hypothetical protein